MQKTPLFLRIIYGDVGTTFKQAKQAGLTELFPVEERLWGDRTRSVKESFGITWTLATHLRDVPAEKMEEGRKRMASKAA